MLSKRQQNIILIVALLALVPIIATLVHKNSRKYKLQQAMSSALVSPIEAEDVERRYGFRLDAYDFVDSTIQKNEFLGDILTRHHVDYLKVDQLSRRAKDIFDVRKLRLGKDYTILTPKNDSIAQYFIYDPSPYRYIVYDLKDTTNVYIVEREVETHRRSASGVIEFSLWQTMMDNNLDYGLASKMEDAFAWSIDFHHIQKGDRFKMIYDEDYIEGERVGVGRLYAGYFKNYDNDYYAYAFKNERYDGFYDEEGRPMKKAFLKAPVKYSRISSRYNLNRYHPVLKRRKPHLGTDYAAPTGTPIYAVANGVVIEARYKRNNGNYVKIKHDKVYTTQYLHMSKIGKGIRSGVHVKQGQVIGYVGSTGLATGPHVCYRFWKNGRQVDPLRQKLPPPEPMAEADLPIFFKTRDSFQIQLDTIDYILFDSTKIEGDTTSISSVE